MTDGPDEIVVEATGPQEIEVSALPDLAVVEVVEELDEDLTALTLVQGPPGPRGPAGPGAAISTDAENALRLGSDGYPYLSEADIARQLVSFVHMQQTPESVWTVSHPLAYAPGVTVVDSAGTTVEGEVAYLDGSVILSFAAPFSGTAYLS